jgi:hypothetical protein
LIHTVRAVIVYAVTNLNGSRVDAGVCVVAIVAAGCANGRIANSLHPRVAVAVIVVITPLINRAVAVVVQVIARQLGVLWGIASYRITHGLSGTVTDNASRLAAHAHTGSTGGAHVEALVGISVAVVIDAIADLVGWRALNGTTNNRGAVHRTHLNAACRTCAHAHFTRIADAHKALVDLAVAIVVHIVAELCSAGCACNCITSSGAVRLTHYGAGV